MEEHKIHCSKCHKDKPIVNGCFIAISSNSDRCKECQDEIQKNAMLREMNKIANELI